MRLRILVTGSRGWTDEDAVYYALREWYEYGRSLGLESVLIHGAAKGLDKLAESIWIGGVNPCHIEEYPADWATHGIRAGVIRNAEMVNLGANVCLAFALKWDSGTGHCARLARKAGIHTVDYGVDSS